jgi:hypothetical protein
MVAGAGFWGHLPLPLPVRRRDGGKRNREVEFPSAVCNRRSEVDCRVI